MDMILNYIFVGFAFIFIMDIVMTKLKEKNYLTPNVDWGWGQRLIAVVIWPIALFWFCISFCKQFFKK
tara:strand:- start:352 stop:555 length:204 start_codon:yes stop_codon:yes gene_type:complete